MIAISSKSERIQRLAQLQSEIAELAEAVRKNSDEIDQTRPRLFTLIRQAAKEGIKPIDLADLTGYSRQRIWQICEGDDEVKTA